MQITVDSVSDIKQGQYGVSSKIKSGNETYFVNEDASKYTGKTIEGDVTEKTSAKGNKYKILNIKGEAAGGAAGNGHGKVEWKEYEQLARVVHKLALELEPDGLADAESNIVIVDRSRARVTFVNTALMALKDGKLWLDDDLPFIWILITGVSIYEMLHQVSWL